ncbi:MAG: dihydrodipicolinate synthase family protein [Acidobacteriia bacterium]|nr:dihydrodipicolinate synthase family protein [Terriglobia bacterium]
MGLDFSGIFPALTTPFGADGAVALADLKHNVSLYNKTGLAGYLAIGSTGESVLLEETEREAVLAAVKEAAAPGKILIAGTGAESTAATIRWTRRAAELGYQAALVKTPYYFKPMYKAEVLAAHFRRVADASPIPVLLYSVPQFTGVALEAGEVEALAAHPNIVGLKESSGNVQRVGEIIAAAPAAFQVLVGSASTLNVSLVTGARGGILALACVLPELCVELYRLARGGSAEGARRLQEALLPASRVIVGANGPAGVKCAMESRGYRGGPPRLPLQPLGEAARQEIGKILAALPAVEAARA